MEKIRLLTLLAATMTTGLMAGLFAAFSYSVMPGLGATDDRTFVASMQRINAAIQNGWFFLLFAGALVFTVLALVLGARPKPWIVAALVLYAATLVITMAVNVPLNDALAAGGSDLAAVRAHFEVSWVRWNVIRMLTNTAAFGCLAWALASRSA